MDPHDIVREVSPTRIPRAQGLRLEATDSIAALAPEWATLAASTGNVFATPEWAEAWMDTLGHGASPRLVVGRDAARRLRLVIPLVLVHRGPLRVARFMGHGVADLQGPIAAPGTDFKSQAVEQLMVDILKDYDVFLGERIPASLEWEGMPGVRILHREVNPLLPLREWGNWETYLASRSRRLRRELRHDERVLAARHALSVRLTTDPERLQADLDVLFALHRARFGNQSSFAPREEFHRRFATLALARGWLRLWILEADGRPAAARYDFSYGGVYHAYNGGRHPDWSRLSVGLVLRKFSLQSAFSERATAYRFLRGGESYKGRFGTVDDPIVTVAASGTWLGRVALAVAYSLRSSSRIRGLVRMRL